MINVRPTTATAICQQLKCEGVSNIITLLRYPVFCISGTSLLGTQGQICFSEFLEIISSFFAQNFCTDRVDILLCSEIWHFGPLEVLWASASSTPTTPTTPSVDQSITKLRKQRIKGFATCVVSTKVYRQYKVSRYFGYRDTKKYRGIRDTSIVKFWYRDISKYRQYRPSLVSTTCEGTKFRTLESCIAKSLVTEHPHRV